MMHPASGDWRPTASLEVLRLRARLLHRIRNFFHDRDVLEVETPVLSVAGTPDPALASFSTHYSGPLFPDGQTFLLHTSPEFPMKRLLAAGSGSIYQICKVFRDGESGRMHNPEFTMLEWYRLGHDYHQLMREVEELVRYINDDASPLQPTEFLTYREAFERTLNLDPHSATAQEFADSAHRVGIRAPDQLLASPDASAWRDLLLTHVVEPSLGRDRLSFIYEFPASQAALARIRPENPPVAERFELYWHGVELANGFHELADPDEHRVRFERQQHARQAQHRPAVPGDSRLLAALDEGLPDCSGVALGVDRLVMLIAGLERIDQALAFPLDRA